jgi:hypothetical protein
VSPVLRLTALAYLALLLVLPGDTSAPASEPPISTFSIVTFDPATCDDSVGVQSKCFAVIDVVPFAHGNLLHGLHGLAMLTEGESTESVIERLWHSPVGAAP